jgi:hypothetical protein
MSYQVPVAGYQFIPRYSQLQVAGNTEMLKIHSAFDIRPRKQGTGNR